MQEISKVQTADVSAAYSHHPLLNTGITFNGKYSTLSNEDDHTLEYPTATVADIFDEIENPAFKIKDEAPCVIFTDHIGYLSRKKLTLMNSSFCVIPADIDTGNLDLDTIVGVITEFTAGKAAFVVYSTSSAKETDKRWRILIAMDRYIPAAAYLFQVDKLNTFISSKGIEVDDCYFKRITQPVYRPNRLSTDTYYTCYRADSDDGMVVDPADVIAVSAAVDTTPADNDTLKNHPVYQYLEKTGAILGVENDPDKVKVFTDCPHKDKHSADTGYKQTMVSFFSAGDYSMTCQHTTHNNMVNGSINKAFLKSLPLGVVEDADSYKQKLDKALTNNVISIIGAGKFKTIGVPAVAPPVPLDLLLPIHSVNPLAHVGPRKFIYRRDYLRGYVSGTAATGGVGKTTLVDAETVAMALGRDILASGEPLRCGQLKCLVLSLEDDLDELTRRYQAIVKHHNLSLEDVALIQKNITQVFDSEGLLKLVKTDGHNKVYKDETSINFLRQILVQQKVDVLTLDPLVSAHEADENSNQQMQVVLSVLRSIARELDIAVHYIHHNRKGGGSSVDDMRGAAALKDGSRVLRVLSKMATTEAGEFGISSDDAAHLIGKFNGKANFEPPAKEKHWYRTVGVPLGNGTDIYDEDFVGVAEAFRMPEPLSAVTNEKTAEAIKVIAGLDEAQRRKSIQSPDWVGYKILPVLGLKPGAAGKKAAHAALEHWEAEGLIETYHTRIGRSGSSSPCIKVAAARPVTE